MTKIAGISGSLRKGSFNTSLLHYIAEHNLPEWQIDTLGLEDIPLFNADQEEGGDPKAAADFKQAISRADGLIVVTPEYSHGMPGVLKNALDWAASVTNENVLEEKPAFVLGASPSPLGTAFAQAQVKQTLAAAGAYVLQQPEVYIGTVQKKLDENGKLHDEKTAEMIKQSLEAFQEWIQAMQPGS
ncbi:chromate reductase [Alteribacillus persepolensis]|uniref:Chromate reductase n=1 Tax=Alteribacillus persepolensis TaxID=568899 RepID=A0A1G8ESE3_9BACI|nr:NAD(P)H-dependent oxidoreductase [Alteribacillus persepolensis]SDH72659.1 chromate reductase [Alteribacillus persepolensis]